MQIGIIGLPNSSKTTIFNALTRGQIESTIYDWRDEPESNVLEVHIHYLRKKLGSDLIKTLRGVGYTIAKP